MAAILGIDPGLHGALVVIGEPQPERPSGIVLDAIAMPLTTCVGEQIVDRRVVGQIVAAHRVGLIAVERQWARGAGPGKNSARSAHTAGRLWGSLLTALQLTGVPTLTVTAIAWQRRYGLLGADKCAALDAAARIFGETWLYQLGLGRRARSKCVRIAFAEAALIAHYARAQCSNS